MLKEHLAILLSLFFILLFDTVHAMHLFLAIFKKDSPFV